MLATEGHSTLTFTQDCQRRGFICRSRKHPLQDYLNHRQVITQLEHIK